MNKKTNFCPYCEELILYVAIRRHNTSNKSEEQPINPTYCPICGTKLEVFPGWNDERIKRRYG